MKYILFFLMFFIVGCGRDNYFYWDVNFSSSKINKTVAIKLILPDYLKSGYVVGIKNNQFLYLKEQIPQSADSFYGNYLKRKFYAEGINIKIFPWDYNDKPIKVYVINIVDYYIDLKNKEAVLRVVFNNKKFVFIKRYKKNYLLAYKAVYDKMIKKLGGYL